MNPNPPSALRNKGKARQEPVTRPKANFQSTERQSTSGTYASSSNSRPTLPSIWQVLKRDRSPSPRPSQEPEPNEKLQTYASSSDGHPTPPGIGKGSNGERSFRPVPVSNKKSRTEETTGSIRGFYVDEPIYRIPILLQRDPNAYIQRLGVERFIFKPTFDPVHEKWVFTSVRPVDPLSTPWFIDGESNIIQETIRSEDCERIFGFWNARDRGRLGLPLTGFLNPFESKFGLGKYIKIGERVGDVFYSTYQLQMWVDPDQLGKSIKIEWVNVGMITFRGVEL